MEEKHERHRGNHHELGLFGWPFAITFYATLIGALAIARWRVIALVLAYAKNY